MTDFVVNPQSNDATLVTAGGLTKVFANTPTITAALYASGNNVGGKIALTGFGRTFYSGNGATGLIQSVVITDKAAQNASTDVIFFNANPSNTTFTDKSALSINSADVGTVIGVVHVTDWITSGIGIGQAQNLALPFVLAAGTEIWVALVTRGTPTYASTSDLTVNINILQD